MNNSIDYKEFSEMRQQIDALRTMLDKESMINERMMRRAMSEKSNKLAQNSIVIIVIALISIPFVFWAIQFIGADTVFGYTAAIFMLIAAIYEFYVLCTIQSISYTRSSMIQIATALANYKRLNSRWLLFSIPFSLIWIGCLIWTISSIDTTIATGIVVGFVTGSIAGIARFSKSQREATEIIKSIRELS